MLYGHIEQYNGWIFIKVDGYPRMKYLWYSKREAVARYRELNNLKRCKINWY